MESQYVWAIVDEGCSSCCHGEYWLENAREKWRKIGYRPEVVDNSYSTSNGIGIGLTKGKYALPFAVITQRSGIPLPGVLESSSVGDSSTPLLLSQAVQAKFGFRKDIRRGTIELIDYEGESLKVVRQIRTGLFHGSN